MNLCRCERGHFYDREKYATCPHCAGGSAADDKLTEAFTQGATVPIDAAPATAAGAGTSTPPVSTAPIQSVPYQQAPPVAPQQSPWPTPGLSANQVTIGSSVVNNDTPTEPLDFAPGNTENMDDCTIGFFDDVFNNTSSDTNSRASAKVSGAAPVKKVSTPCVGWLVALGGAHLGTDFRLKVGKNFIGRNPQMDVALVEDKSVSRDRHAIVVYEPKAHLYLVQPGESSSLVYRNNEVVLTPMRLDAYDVITVGDVNLLFIPLCGEKFNWGDLFETMKKKDK